MQANVNRAVTGSARAAVTGAPRMLCRMPVMSIGFFPTTWVLKFNTVSRGAPSRISPRP